MSQDSAGVTRFYRYPVIEAANVERGNVISAGELLRVSRFALCDWYQYQPSRWDLEYELAGHPSATTRRA